MKTENERTLSKEIIGAAMSVHSYWGPGLLESIYEKSLVHELKLRGIQATRQFKLDLKYKDFVLEDDFFIDLLVEEKFVVELKAVKELAPIHEAQLMTYMKLLNCSNGLLINFNVTQLKQGIRRLSL